MADGVTLNVPFSEGDADTAVDGILSAKGVETKFQDAEGCHLNIK